MPDRAPILSLAVSSLWNRRLTAALTVASVAISVVLLTGVDRVRTETRSGFANTVSGTDLIVGARSGPINLLLYSVFRIGDATNNISWSSYQDIVRRDEVAWAIPLSLGDSHRGFRVLATTDSYFEHYRFGDQRRLLLANGRPFAGTYEAVVGAEVARELEYGVGRQIVLSHGIGDTSFMDHGDLPFEIVGVLSRTGTPVDRTVHIRLDGMEAIHAGGPQASRAGGADAAREGVEPQSITAFLLGLKSRMAIFGLQRYVNEYDGEPLMAIIPGVALQQLWNIIGIAETALVAVTVMVALAGLLGMSTMILASLGERRREMAILRSVGARPWHIFSLLLLEACLLAAAGAVTGFIALRAILLAVQETIIERFGIYLAAGGAPQLFELWVAIGVVGTAALLSLLPAWRAYRYSLADGLAVRI